MHIPKAKMIMRRCMRLRTWIMVLMRPSEGGVELRTVNNTPPALCPLKTTLTRRRRERATTQSLVGLFVRRLNLEMRRATERICQARLARRLGMGMAGAAEWTKFRVRVLVLV
jgi:hypothetical protein